MSSLLRSLNTLMQIQCKLLNQRQNEYLKVGYETRGTQRMFGKFLLTTNTKSNIIRTHCHPMQGNADSGIREIFACGILNPGLWNPEYSFRNPPYFRLESGVPVQLTKNSETNTQNPESMAWNPESTTVLDSLTRDEHWLNVYMHYRIHQRHLFQRFVQVIA